MRSSFLPTFSPLASWLLQSCSLLQRTDFVEARRVTVHLHQIDLLFRRALFNFRPSCLTDARRTRSAKRLFLLSLPPLLFQFPARLTFTWLPVVNLMRLNFGFNLWPSPGQFNESCFAHTSNPVDANKAAKLKCISSFHTFHSFGSVLFCSEKLSRLSKFSRNKYACSPIYTCTIGKWLI